MKLALALGRTLDELMQTMTAREFGLWATLNANDPWDYTRQDVNAGVIAATVANYAGKMRRSGTKPAVPGDFMPYLKQQDEQPQVDPDPLDFFGKV